MRSLGGIFLFFVFASTLWAEDVKVEMVWPKELAAGQTAIAALRLDHAAGWHTYGKGEAGQTTVKWSLPPGWTSESIRWPAPEKFETGGMAAKGYSKTVWLELPFLVAGNAKEGQSYHLTANVSWVACEQGECVPGGKTFTKEMAVAVKPRAAPALSLAIVGGAFLGGLILNLMPCVFPVLGIKALSFLKQGNTKKAAGLAIAYALGIIISLCVLGGLILALRGSGEALGWGFQLQNPVFVWAMAGVMGLIAMNLAGGFELPSVGGSVLGCLSGQGFWPSFVSGILMVLLATPCSAPFLAGALSGVFILPPLKAMILMVAMGLGLATPYLLLVAFPGLLAFLPKPGAWMEDLKKILAWLMAASALYLGWVYEGQVASEAGLTGLMCLALVFFGVWCIARWSGLGRALGFVILIAGLYGGLFNQAAASWSADATANDSQDWEPWSNGEVERLRTEGRTVVVDFTARWCVNCLINERVVWDDPKVRALVKANNIALLKADWTNRDFAISQELMKHGRAAVPFVLIYKPRAMKPIELANLLSVNQVLEALR